MGGSTNYEIVVTSFVNQFFQLSWVYSIPKKTRIWNEWFWTPAPFSNMPIASRNNSSQGLILIGLFYCLYSSELRALSDIWDRIDFIAWLLAYLLDLSNKDKQCAQKKITFVVNWSSYIADRKACIGIYQFYIRLCDLKTHFEVLEDSKLSRNLTTEIWGLG